MSDAMREAREATKRLMRGDALLQPIDPGHSTPSSADRALDRYARTVRASFAAALREAVAKARADPFAAADDDGRNVTRTWNAALDTALAAIARVEAEGA